MDPGREGERSSSNGPNGSPEQQLDIPYYRAAKSPILPPPPVWQEVWAHKVMNSCVTKGLMSGVAGFGMGALFGLFSATTDPTEVLEQNKDLPRKERIKNSLRNIGARTYSVGKSFGLIGVAFATTECVIEKARAKHDIYNGMSAGCLVGGGMGMAAGPKAALVGCAGFAAFSAAIEHFLRP